MKARNMSAGGSLKRQRCLKSSADTVGYRRLIGILLLASVMQAKDVKVHESGTLLQMDSVECGYAENSGKTIAGEILGTDSAHKKTQAVLCPEYVVQSEKITYRIRPRDEKHPVLLPVGERAQFRMEKDKMKLRVEDLDDKEREYQVVSMKPRSDAKAK